MEQPCLSCRILSPLPLISSLLKELISFPAPPIASPSSRCSPVLAGSWAGPEPRSPWTCRQSCLRRGGLVSQRDGEGAPQFPASCQCNVLGNESSGRALRFFPGHPCLGAGRISSCVLYLLQSLLLFLGGGGGSSRDTIYTLIYIYTYMHLF